MNDACTRAVVALAITLLIALFLLVRAPESDAFRPPLAGQLLFWPIVSAWNRAPPEPARMRIARISKTRQAERRRKQDEIKSSAVENNFPCVYYCIDALIYF